MPSAPSHVYFRTPKKTRPEAPLFVFLPGMDGTGQLLRAQTEGLEAAFDIRCLAIPPDDLANWDQLVEQVSALIRTEIEGEYSRSVYLCGESFGGCLAIKVALRSPDLFNRIILVNPASSFHRQPLMQWGSLINYWIPEPLYQASCVAFLPFLASLGRIEASDRLALLEAVQSVPQQTSLWRQSLLREFRVNEAELGRIKQPVLVIASGSDRLLPSCTEATYLVEQIPDARMLVLPDSGHACLLEKDVNLYQLMLQAEFLDKSASLLAA